MRSRYPPRLFFASLLYDTISSHTFLLTPCFTTHLLAASLFTDLIFTKPHFITPHPLAVSLPTSLLTDLFFTKPFSSHLSHHTSYHQTFSLSVHLILIFAAIFNVGLNVGSTGQVSASEAGWNTTREIEHPIRMPARFHHGLVYLEPVSQGGDTLRFFTDTADATLMYRQAVDRTGLTTTSAIIQGQQQLAAFLPPFDSLHFIPPPLVSDGLIPVRPDDRMPPHHRIILGDDDGVRTGDGILGSTWFASRAWSINFREETFDVIPVSGSESGSGSGAGTNGANQQSENPDSAIQPPETAVPLTFYEEGDRRMYHFPGIDVVIAGDTVSMVLKTGSNIILNSEAQSLIGHPDALLPTGLISESVAEKWLDAHPEWTIYENADSNYGSDLIEVPEVRIGPHTAGPVRFAIRHDEAFVEWFSQFTYKPVVGALGSDAFRDTHITINYPWSVLDFHD